MTTPLRRRLRLARRGAWYAFALLLVLTALAAGAVSRLLPLAERHPDKVAAWLGERAGRPVAFDRLETQWTRRGPLLRVDGLRLGEGAQAVRIGEAEILVAQYAGLLPGRSFTELRLRGLQLVLGRDDDGSWQVRGLPGEGQGGDPLEALEPLGELQVIGGRLTLDAPALGIETTLARIDLRLQVHGDRVRAAARAWIDEDAAPVQLALDLDRHGGGGRAHASVVDADLGAWAPLLHHAGIAVESGRGRAQLWLQLQQRRVQQVSLDAALAKVVLRGVPLEPGKAAPRQQLDELQARARWQAHTDGWRLDAPRLRLARDGAAQVLDGLAVAGGARFALRAARIDAGPLLSVLALGDRLQPGLRSWLLAAVPDVQIHELALAREADGRVRAHARLRDLRIGSVGEAPGLEGLAGTLDADAHGFRFQPDPDARLRFDWPAGFGAPHVVTLRGEVAGWREGAGLRVGSPALRIQGEGYAGNLRGGIWFQNDGTRPVLDLAASIDDARVPVARRFWVRHRMPEAARRWLDEALVDGQVRDGRALVSGDLDHWPFSSLGGNGHAGLFHADARLAGAVVKFQPDWPALERLDARVAFVNDGFTLSGQGSLDGVEIRDIDAGLAHYGDATLQVQARPSGDATQLLGVLDASPLRRGLEDTFDSLSASGPVTATFALSLPLDGGGTGPAVSGQVELAGVALADARWKLGFDQVRGRARYDQHGFDGNGLSAVRDGRPGTLSLRAGRGHVRWAGAAFEADMDAVLGARDLLQHAPQLDWLAPHLHGRSRWQVALAIPREQRGTTGAARLQLSSSLEGTALDLPEPLAKPAAVALPATITTSLPLGEGEIAVDLGGRLALRARSAGTGTGVRVVLGASRVDQAPPATGLAASGHAAVLDALGWATLATGDAADGAVSMPLRGIDVTASRLQLLGAAFPDVRLRVDEGDGATEVDFDGEALAGSLRLPRERGATVSGSFARLHWPLPPPDSDAPAQGPIPAMAERDAVDPAGIPPLALDVAEFRFGDLALGRLELRTRQTAAGLQIERLLTRSQRQSIDLSGSWSGRGAAGRTHLRARADSRDFGELMAGFGFGKSIDGGAGRLEFDAQWPRSPGDFALATLQGELSLAITDGRLIEVEPGAGRVLGLLSIAQLPRRLMLDFRDFFAKGFAFNRLDGRVSIGGGVARSDVMEIEGPAAGIRMHGRSDLRAQTHDQVVEVTPRTGNLLPAVGAIAGGPVGAAVGAVANAMLRKPLGEIGARTYRVTGPWKDPQVQVVESTGVPQAAAATRRPPVPRDH